MNFLAEVISSAQEVEMEKLNETVPSIKSKIEQHEREVSKFIESHYKNYEEAIAAKLILQSEKLKKNMTKLKEEVTEANGSNIKCKERMQELSNKVQEADITLSITRILLEVHDKLESAMQLHSSGSYIQAVKTLTDLEQNLDSLPEESIADFIIPHAVNTRKVMENQLREVIEDNLTMKNDEENNSAILTVDGLNRIRCVEAMHVLETAHPSENPVFYCFQKFLFDCMLKRIVIGNVRIDVSVQGDQSVQIAVITEEKKGDKPTYEAVFVSLRKFLEGLRSTLALRDGSCPLLALIGEETAEDLQTLIIDECLARTIPQTEQELAGYVIVAEKVQELRTFLIETGIFREEEVALTEYVQGIDDLFLAKKCERLFEKAVALMRKDLHDSVEVSDEKDGESKAYLSFESCQVSKCCLELITLVKTFLGEYSDPEKYGDHLQEKIFNTVDTIFGQYATTVKNYHSKLLESIPQQSALFRNNCYYLSHAIMNDANFRVGYKLNLENHAPLLISVGNHCLESFVGEQQRQIESIVNDSGLNDLQTSDAINDKVEKSVRQCLRQQELLKTVWQKVLPYDVYNKTVGQLLGAFCQCLTSKVIAASDISSTAAEQLVDIFNVVITRGPKLLSEPKEINMYVENWNKFKHLIMILSSGLIEISDQWADGKGPLALYFTSAEIKQLIRAIFQNTERRRVVLSKIL